MLVVATESPHVLHTQYYTGGAWMMMPSTPTRLKLRIRYFFIPKA
jgi:hypothetical protein